VAGLLAAGPALLVLVVGRGITDRPGLVEVISDGFSRYLPLSLFELGVSTLGPLAKGLLTLGIAAGILVAGAVVGDIGLRRLAVRGRARAFVTISLAALAAVELAVLPIFGAGFLGLDLASDALAVQLPVVVAALTYAGLLVGLRETWLEIDAADAPAAHPPAALPPAVLAPVPLAPEVPHIRPTPAVGELSRRRFVGGTIAVAGAAAVAGSLTALASQVLDAVRHGGSPQTADVAPGGFGPTLAQTPVDDFYTVNKNLAPTVVDGPSWALVIDGLVDRPGQLTLDQIRALPYQEAYRTLECISTEIVRGDHLIGNQHWRGVRVADLLDRVGARPEARWILWEADDGFTESIPLEVARHPDTWIAYQMADAPLTVEHGFPVRVLIPGRFGMKQPKWLRRMQLADHDETGYWEQRGWDRDAVQRTMSRIDWPRHRATVTAGEPFMAFGIAFAGDRGISRVEVSPDDGATWLEAELEDATVAPLGELSWVRWRIALTIAAPGVAQVAVRATDGDGATQSGEVTASLPSGSTGWHSIQIVAAAASGG
jgi:DMSO/TMAO reductase YedYZ molybdopterin-dependent catalytic subunit